MELPPGSSILGTSGELRLSSHSRNDMGQSDSGTEMSIYTLVVQAKTDDMRDFKCTRKKVKETRRFIRWVMTTSEQNGNVMPCKLAHYKGKQSSKRRSKSKSTLPDDWCHLISQNHIMPV